MAAASAGVLVTAPAKMPLPTAPLTWIAAVAIATAAAARPTASERARVQRQAAAADGGDEARPGGEARRVDERGEAQHPHVLRQHPARADGAGADPDEEHRGDAEREPSEGHAPDQEPDRTHSEEEEHRILGDEGDHLPVFGELRRR